MFGFQKPSGQDLMLLGAGVLGGEDISSGFSKGFGLVAGNRARQGKSGQRKILKDAQGFQRYADTGERVFPGVTKSDPAMRDPAKLQLYKFAKDEGFEGNFMDFIKATKGGTTVNNTFSPGGTQVPEYSKLPPGYVYPRDPETRQIALSPEGIPTAVPVPGSPAAQKEEAAKQKAQLNTEMKQRDAGIVGEMGRKAINLIKKGGIRFPVTGLGAELAATFGGTEAADMKNILSTLKAKSAFGALTELRAASPTGGALGGVSEMELKLLENAYGSLQQSQSAEQLAQNIARFVQMHEDVVHHGLNADGSRRTGNPQGSDVSQTPYSPNQPSPVKGGFSKKHKLKWEIVNQ